MPQSARDLATEAVAYLGEEITLDGTGDTAMPTGSRTFLVNCINRGLEQMRTEAEAMFKQTIGIQWGPSAAGTVNAVNGDASVTMGTLVAPDDGCTVALDGDSTLNELRASATEDGTYLLLHPFNGTTGAVNATNYADSVLLDVDVDRVLGACLLHEQRPLEILTSRDEWLRWGSLGTYPVRDYGGSGGPQPVVRQPGTPRAIWIESFTDPEGDAIRYRARCAPLPSGAFRATIEVLSAVREIEDEDLDDGSDAYLPVPGGRSYGILRALVMYKWSGSPWFKNADARAMIAEDYKEALGQLANFSANAAASVSLGVRY